MQSDPSFLFGKVAPPDAYGAGPKHDFLPNPLNGFEFEPAENCPKNFIIFDQTARKSRVVFNPALAEKFDYHGDCTQAAEKNNKGKSQYSSSFKEDTEDINALLSSGEDSEDSDLISTGRTPNYQGGSSPDSVHSSSSSCSEKKKKKRLRKMVKALREIVPGGEAMDTPAIIDEAVKYLKSLKVEVKKLGTQNVEG